MKNFNILSDEKEFLLKLILNAYNKQYNENFKTKDFDLKSIIATKFSHVGYEAISLREDDFLRIRAYFNLIDKDLITGFRVEVEGDRKENNLGDEVFVAFGGLDIKHKHNGTYRFLPLMLDEKRLNVILTEDEDTISLEDGELIALEN